MRHALAVRGRVGAGGVPCLDLAGIRRYGALVVVLGLADAALDHLDDRGTLDTHTGFHCPLSFRGYLATRRSNTSWATFAAMVGSGSSTSTWICTSPRAFRLSATVDTGSERGRWARARAISDTLGRCGGLGGIALYPPSEPAGHRPRTIQPRTVYEHELAPAPELRHVPVADVPVRPHVSVVSAARAVALTHRALCLASAQVGATIAKRYVRSHMRRLRNHAGPPGG